MDNWPKELALSQGAVDGISALLGSPTGAVGRAAYLGRGAAGRARATSRARHRSTFTTGHLASRDSNSPFARWFSPRSSKQEVVVNTEISAWKEETARFESSGTAARSNGNEREAEAGFREGLGSTRKAVTGLSDTSWHRERVDALRAAVRLALDCGEAAEAHRLLDAASEAGAPVACLAEWEEFRDVEAWPDAWLVAAVRRDPPDSSALDVLAARYWKPLFGRCYLLTLDHEKAADLAQQAWTRVLRARQRLNPGGNFPAYLSTAAINLWRDAHRSAKRAGPLADERIASLDQASSADDRDETTLVDALPDLKSLQAAELTLLKLDLDHALGKLSPHLREVLVARFIEGESCAEIGRRHGRTEQTVSGWVREAIREIRFHLGEASCAHNCAKEP